MPAKGVKNTKLKVKRDEAIAYIEEVVPGFGVALAQHRGDPAMRVMLYPAPGGAACAALPAVPPGTVQAAYPHGQRMISFSSPVNNDAYVDGVKRLLARVSRWKVGGRRAKLNYEVGGVIRDEDL
mmetsp:Transcript_20426/g.46886  ORF Transcript_20426/g.46886 Transcript_20426/m.46886 type:complete len:125 (-) Transcript_20426:52-426(-)